MGRKEIRSLVLCDRRLTAREEHKPVTAGPRGQPCKGQAPVPAPPCSRTAQGLFTVVKNVYELLLYTV